MASVAGGQLGQANTLSNGIISCLNAGCYGPSTSSITSCIFPNTSHSSTQNTNLNNIPSNYFHSSPNIPLASTSSTLNSNEHSGINNGTQNYFHKIFTPSRSSRSIAGTPPTPEPSPLDFLNDILQVWFEYNLSHILQENSFDKISISLITILGCDRRWCSYVYKLRRWFYCNLPL